MKRAAVVWGLAGLAGVAHAQPNPGWEVRLADRLELASGASGALSLAIAVDRGLVVSKDAQVIVDVTTDAGIVVKKPRLGRGDAVDPEADAPRFAIAVRGEVAGDHPMKVRVRFWVCAARTCRPIEVTRDAVIVVTPPPG